MEQEISSKVYGYARVSTEQQLLTAQLNKLQAAGIPKNQIFSEKVTGLSKFETRKAFNKLMAIAEAERTRILERTEEGRQVAKLNGVKFGRKRKSNYEALIQEKERGLTNKEIAEKFNVSLQYLSYVFKNYNA